MLASLHQANTAFVSDRRSLDADILPAFVVDNQPTISGEVVLEIRFVYIHHDIVRSHNRLPITPTRNDGVTVHKLVAKDVPVDGFWSITVYNADGYMQANPFNAYSLNNITPRRAPMARSRCNSVAATARFRAVYQS
jgi:hypothetical protein